MGLLDVLNGMQNGPRGQQQPAPQGGSRGMSPWMMALLGMLAYKAIKGGGLGNMLGGGQSTAPPQQPAPGANGGGGLGDILGGLLGGGTAQGGAGAPGGLGGLLGGLGGLLGGATAGSGLNNGLKNLLSDMEANGQGEAARSWVGPGANQHVAPNDLAKAIGIDDIDAVAKQTGMPREQVLSALSEHLPEFVNQLTPDGRLPTDHEASRWV
jgi:uncharacterized protein YidB (DUF937 family)